MTHRSRPEPTRPRHLSVPTVAARPTHLPGAALPPTASLLATVDTRRDLLRRALLGIASLGLVAFVVWIPAALGRVGRRLIVGAGLLPVLFTLQHVFPAMDQAAVRALHPLNGALIFALSLWLMFRLLDLLRHRPSASVP